MHQRLSGLKIAVDFDGTIVAHEYPEIGEELLFAFDTLRALQNQGALLILWTFRAGKSLEEAVVYCREHGIEFYAVNSNYPEEKFSEHTQSRKINADIYIDDKNLGGFPGWSVVWETLNPYEELEEEAGKRLARYRRRRWWKNLFRRKKENHDAS